MHLCKTYSRMVRTQKSVVYFNQLFLVPQPNNRWRPISDLSSLNQFLRTEIFKMDNKDLLLYRSWVMSIDFKDAYFHIPIQNLSRKYLHFHVQGQSYQFKALSFGQSTAPLEFAVVVKEVKLMAFHKGIRVHQYLETCFPAYTNYSSSVSGAGLDGKQENLKH